VNGRIRDEEEIKNIKQFDFVTLTLSLISAILAALLSFDAIISFFFSRALAPESTFADDEVLKLGVVWTTAGLEVLDAPDTEDVLDMAEADEFDLLDSDPEEIFSLGGIVVLTGSSSLAAGCALASFESNLASLNLAGEAAFALAKANLDGLSALFGVGLTAAAGEAAAIVAF
jgi:hypothetical protein